LNKNHNQMI